MFHYSHINQQEKKSPKNEKPSFIGELIITVLFIAFLLFSEAFGKMIAPIEIVNTDKTVDIQETASTPSFDAKRVLIQINNTAFEDSKVSPIENITWVNTNH